MELFSVKNIIGGIVVAKVPNENRIFQWKGYDSIVKVNFEDLERMIYDADTRRIFDTGLLWIEDKACRIRLGLEEEDGTTNFSSLIYDKKQIISLLFADSFKVFQEKVVQLSDGSKELMIQVALDNPKPLDIEKSDYIRKNYFVDIEAIRRERREAAIEEKK